MAAMTKFSAKILKQLHQPVENNVIFWRLKAKLSNNPQQINWIFLPGS